MVLLRNCLGGLLLAVLVSSCGIRLPIDTRHFKRQAVRIDATAATLNPPEKSPQDPELLVWMIADKYHTGMVFPFDWLVESGYIPPEGIGTPKYITMSWGNRNAYSKEGIDNSWKMMRVLFTPTPSVMEVIPTNGNVVEVCPQQRVWRKLVRRDCGPRLAAFLNQCSVMTSAGKPQVVCASSWGKGVQVEGRHSYFIPRVCNVWTAQTIECTGGRINPWMGLTADGMVRQIEGPPNHFEKVWDAYQKEERAPEL